MTVCAPRKGEKGMEQGLGVRTKCSSIFFPVFILKKRETSNCPDGTNVLVILPFVLSCIKKEGSLCSQKTHILVREAAMCTVIT